MHLAFIYCFDTKSGNYGFIEFISEMTQPMEEWNWFLFNKAHGMEVNGKMMSFVWIFVANDIKGYMYPHTHTHPNTICDTENMHKFKNECKSFSLKSFTALCME